MWKQWRFVVLFIIILLCFSIDQEFLESQLNPPRFPPLPPQKITVARWQQILGLKIIKLRQTIPVSKKVVLVPDEATFLSAIEQWSLQERYPILIEDDRYTPLFLERFQPQEIIRLPAVEQPLPPLLNQRQLAMQKAVASAWETDENNLKKTWQKLGWKPPGVVITTVNDPAALAAVALAADRGQPLQFLEGYFGKVNQTLSSRGWENLNEAVNDLVASTGYEYQRLGDTIDTITLVRTLPVKYRSPKNQDLRAVTDGLGRHENGQRYAIAGWIYGSPERAIYQAMCSIFLQAETILLYDSYPKTEGWERYHFDELPEFLQQFKLEVKHIEKPTASRESWDQLMAQPWNYHLAFINSRGGKANFAVGNGDKFVKDIPQLQTPTMMHMIHSFSATTPEDIDTIAGRWLENGVYAYIGSVDEPYVTGFVPPKSIIARSLLNIPLLVAARYVDTPPWKITTIGDPLTLIRFEGTIFDSNIIINDQK